MAADPAHLQKASKIPRGLCTPTHIRFFRHAGARDPMTVDVAYRIKRWPHATALASLARRTLRRNQHGGAASEIILSSDVLRWRL